MSALMELKERILVVDDDPNIRGLLKEALRDEGFEVIVAVNGEDGLYSFQEHKPNLMVVDGLLPKINGFELVAKVRASELGKSMPIVMISGIYKALKMTSQIRDLGLNEFIEKPFDIFDTVHRIKQLLQVNIEKPGKEAEVLPPKGNLSTLSVARLFYLLYRTRENGALFLAHEKMKKKIHIRSGEPTFVESNLVQECLGKLLVRKGRLTPEQVEESLTLMRSKKAKQGETLIKMGLLNPNELDEALRDQAREKILEIFTWPNGTYVFAPEENTTKQEGPSTVLDLNIAQIIVRGVRNGVALERLKQELDGYLDKPILIRTNERLSFEEFRLASWDERVRHEFDGKKSLRDLLTNQNARELDVYQLIYAFLKTDMIEFVESDEEKKERQLHQKLLKQLDELRDLDYFALLAVDQRASTEQIQQALGKRLKFFFPEAGNFNTMHSTKVRNLLAEIATVLETGCSTLTEPLLRQAYERQLFLSKGIIPVQPDRVFNLKDELRKIREVLNRGDLEKAAISSRQAVQLFPKDGVVLAIKTWVEFKLLVAKGKPTQSQIEDALKHLANAIKLDSDKPEGYLYAGYLYKFIDDMTNAKLFFDKALFIDRNCTEAERELRLIAMRGNKKNKSFLKWK